MTFRKRSLTHEEVSLGMRLTRRSAWERLYNYCECDIGMGLEWSGNETHQEVRVVKVEEFVHKVEDAQP